MRITLSALAFSALMPLTAAAQSDGKFFEPEPMTLTEAIFQTMDANLNETLAPAEIEFYFRYMFLVLDEDDSGAITPPEFANVYPALLPIPLDALENGQEEMQKEFFSFDTNEDKELSLDELVARYADQVTSIDTNKDGLITLDEYGDHTMIKYYNALEEQFLEENPDALNMEFEPLEEEES